MAKENKSDKFVVYIQRASTAFPIVRINKCDQRGKIVKNLTPRAIWHRSHGKDDYVITALQIGRLILKNSQNVKSYRKAKR